jgi:DNA topoisomerase-1
LVFDGFLALDPAVEDDEGKVDLSPYEKSDVLKLVEVKPSQHFTKPPPRFSEASLVKTLEEEGIGRPSTYASIISTIVARNYVIRERGYFNATELGMKICDLLVLYFPTIMDIGFTAGMEERLDMVEEGDLAYAVLLKEFYGPFKKELDHAMATIEKTTELIDEKCPECGRPLAVKWGRRVKFLSCSGFPECKFAKPITTGVKCPQPDCAGELVKRRGKSGRAFYGCSKYPACTFTANTLPEAPVETKTE